MRSSRFVCEGSGLTRTEEGRGGCEEGEANRAEEAVEGPVVESEGPRGRGAVAACLW